MRPQTYDILMALRNAANAHDIAVSNGLAIPYSADVFMEVLEELKPTLFGVSLEPKKVLKLRREIQRRFYTNPEELQKD